MKQRGRRSTRVGRFDRRGCGEGREIVPVTLRVEDNLQENSQTRAGPAIVSRLEYKCEIFAAPRGGKENRGTRVAIYIPLRAFLAGFEPVPIASVNKDARYGKFPAGLSTLLTYIPRVLYILSAGLIFHEIAPEFDILVRALLFRMPQCRGILTSLPFGGNPFTANG